MKSFNNFNEAVKGQDTESRKEGAKERAADKKSGKIRKNTLDPKDYATQQKKSIEWHDKRTKGRFMPGQVTDVHEVAPPGWGHTKAEKEKTDPSKPKSKIGGTAAAFKRALDRGDFKGLPGDKTKKEKTASMFKLMWAMKKKGDKPHYKPGTDEKYKKYQDESVGFTIDSGEHKKASKKAKIRNLAKGNTNPNEKAAAEKKAGGPKLIGEVLSGKDTKKLAKASILSTSDDPKKQDRARARQVEIDYKDLMDQRKKKKVGVGKSMREEKKSCPEGEYYCFDMGKCRPIPDGHKVREDGELVKEDTSIIRGNTSKKKVSYRGATSDHKRDKDGNIVASHYKKEKPNVVFIKKKDTRTDAQKKKHSDAVRKFDNYQKLKDKVTAKDAARKKHNQEYHARKRATGVNEQTSMKDNNLFGNAYAGSKRQKKKAIEAIPDKSTEVYNRNWKHKTPNNPRESVELLGADGKVAHEIIDIIKPEPMKVPESPMKWKELVEKVKLPAVNGSIVDVYLTWRGRGISIKLFFPQSRTRRPTREEVNSQIQKVYPGAKVGNFIESDPEPGQPFLQVGD